MEDRREGLESPGPLTWVRPQGARVLSLGRCTAPHLFQAVHVFEVEADVEQTQVRVDKLELGGRQLGSSCSPALPSPVPSPSVLLASAHACSLTKTTLMIRCLS